MGLFTWRAPVFCSLHAARDVGASAITTVGTVDTDYPIANLINERSSMPFKWTDSSVHSIDIDLGANYVTGIDYIYIPMGHTVAGVYVEVEQDDNAGFTSPTNLFTDTSTMDPTAPLYEAFTTPSSERYLRVKFPLVSGAWEISELWLTKQISLTEGIEHGWIGEKISDDEVFSNGLSIALADDELHYVLTYRGSGSSVPADLAALETFIDTVSMDKPFVLIPPWSWQYPGIFKLDRPAVNQAEPLVPSRLGLGMRRIELSMREFKR